MMWAGWDKYIGNYIIVFHSFPGNILSSAVFFNYNNVYFYTFRKHKAKWYRSYNKNKAIQKQFRFFPHKQYGYRKFHSCLQKTTDKK